MTRFTRTTTIITLVAALAATSRTALAQCPNGLPQSVINSIQTPEIRQAATINTWLDPATIRENGGLPNMIELSRRQIAADRATIAEEQRNQAYLAQNGMANDARAIDGRKVIQMLTESQRLTQAAVEVMECHARMGSTPGESPLPIGPAASAPSTGSSMSEDGRQSTLAGHTPTATNGPLSGGLSMTGGQRQPTHAVTAPTGTSTRPRDVWSMSAADRQSALAGELQSVRTREPGEDFARAMDGISRRMRERAMENATPEVAAFWARQDLIQANAAANVAASAAGRRQGQVEAQRDSLDKQVQMVNDAVTSWRPPRSYSASSAVSAGAIEDPFATTGGGNNAETIRAALGTSGLVWDEARRIARVGARTPLMCGGRLKDGDYPVLPDGSLLDTADRIKQFQASCSDPASPLVVVRESGDVEVRQ
jgi:hypothetical protein